MKSEWESSLQYCWISLLVRPAVCGAFFSNLKFSSKLKLFTQSNTRICVGNSTLYFLEAQADDTRVFPKIDYSANVARIVLVEYTIANSIGTVVEIILF